MRVLLTLTAAIAGCSLMAAAAHAYSYPGQQPWADTTADATYYIADAHWAAQGLPGPRPVMMTATSLLDPNDGIAAIGRASTMDQTIWIDRALLWRAVYGIRAFRPHFTRQLCAIVTHELGHVRGLAHVNDPGSVMNPAVPAVPAECATAFPDPRTVRTRFRRDGHRGAGRGQPRPFGKSRR